LNKSKKVVLLTGGNSSEREISLATASSVEKALKELQFKYSVVAAEGNFVEQVLLEKPDVVFIAMHGGAGENGIIQGLLETLKIPYTGSGVLASAVCMNKSLSKIIFRHYGIKTPEWEEIKKAEDITIKLPLVIKPVEGGSTIATAIVKTEEQLKPAVENALKHIGAGRNSSVKIMAEEYIPGREFTVGILGGKALPVLEIVSKTEFYDYEAKYMNGMSEHFPPEDIDEKIIGQMQSTAEKAFKAAGCRDMGRVDFRFDGKTFYVLEINTIPGMTGTSLLPEAAQLAGIGFNELVKRILKSASEKV